MNLKIFAIIFAVLFSGGIAIFLLTRPSGILLSPMAKEQPSNVLAAESTPKKTFGFLPFWTIKDVTNDYKDVDVVYYFSLTVKDTGEFDKADPGYARLKSAPKLGKSQGLTIACMKQADIEAVINNPAKRKKVIDNTLAIMKENNFSALNIDFEYVGAPPGNLSKNYTKFIQEATDAVHKTGGTVSVDTLSDAVWKLRMYNIADIGKIADYIIVMAYDFTRLTSHAAGPVAPLFGKEKFEYDVYSTVTDYMKVMPAGKIVLGVPFYGYEWPTQDNKPYSFVISDNSALSTIKRTAQTIKDNNATVNFDELSKTPWFAYVDNGRWRQVWFENERSLGLKLDLVNQADLAGLAIWALGYEGSTGSPLWQTIREKLN
ncbi:MAG: glycosyl hydrolase family 18 protein [Patescibacteria group bacterium]